jgi:hypothetical protein
MNGHLRVNGLRELSPAELADVWNSTPILLQDHFRKQGREGLLACFTTCVPAKILSVGADYLVSYGFRGGV